MTALTTEHPAPPAPTSASAAVPAPAPLRWLATLATWRVWAVTAAVYLVYAGAFFATRAPFSIPTVQALCGQPPLDMRTTSSAADVNAFLAACGTTGREAYRALQLADLAYPLVFAVFLASSLAMVLSRLAPRRPRLLLLAALPFLASAFDYLENVFAWRALLAFPGTTATDGLLGMASTAKTTTSWLAGGLLVAALVALAVSAVVRRSSRVRPSQSPVRGGVAR